MSDFYYFILHDFTIIHIPYRHLFCKCEYEVKSEISLIETHGGNSLSEHNGFSFPLLSPYRFFSSLFWPCFHITLPWFISSTPAAELDRIIIGSCNVLMNLRRSRRTVSSHVRSLDADAIDPKSHLIRYNFLLLLSMATQSMLNVLNLKTT